MQWVPAPHTAPTEPPRIQGQWQRWQCAHASAWDAAARCERVTLFQSADLLASAQPDAKHTCFCHCRRPSANAGRVTDTPDRWLCPCQRQIKAAQTFRCSSNGIDAQRPLQYSPTPTSDAAPREHREPLASGAAPGIDRLQAIQRRIKQQQAALPPSSYSVVATQVRFLCHHAGCFC